LEQIAWYAGWYAEHASGPFAHPSFQFAPGAFAYHLHSFSAGDIRNPGRQWVGPLLARGAAASMGSVDEPYLHLTPQPDILAERLLRGFPFAEAAHFSQRELSWQNTFLGDPLYRPFLHSLETQIRHLEADEHPALPWAYLRQINIQARAGRLHIALDLCRKRIQQTRSTILAEKLADLYAENGMHDEALAEYQGLLPAAASPESAFRVAGKIVEVLRASHRTPLIPTLVETLAHMHPNHRCLPWLQRLAYPAPSSTP
jgi:tetratricopeptide (TPR) repeat protein